MRSKNRWWWLGLSGSGSHAAWSDCGYNLKVGPRGFATGFDVGVREDESRVTVIFQAWAIKKQACDIMGEWEESRILFSSRKRKRIVGRIGYMGWRES